MDRKKEISDLKASVSVKLYSQNTDTKIKSTKDVSLTVETFSFTLIFFCLIKYYGNNQQRI